MKRANVSMQLTRAADYAVRVMVQLATLPADARGVAALAGAGNGRSGKLPVESATEPGTRRIHYEQ